MNKSDNKGLRRIWRACGWSMQGFKDAFAHEAAFRQEVALVLILVPLGLWLGKSGTDRALLIGSLLLVPIVELLNSAVEAAVDRIGSEHHELAGRAKDFGSAAVFLAIANTVLVWLLVLGG